MPCTGFEPGFSFSDPMLYRLKYLTSLQRGFRISATKRQWKNTRSTLGLYETTKRQKLQKNICLSVFILTIILSHSLRSVTEFSYNKTIFDLDILPAYAVSDEISGIAFKINFASGLDLLGS